MAIVDVKTEKVIEKFVIETRFGEIGPDAKLVRPTWNLLD